MKMKHTLPTSSMRSTLIGVGFAVALPSLAQAAVIYSEDFDGYAAGSAIQQVNVDPDSHWLYTTNKNDVSFTAENDATNIFGPGTNQYGSLSDSSTTNDQPISVASTKFDATEVGQISFDFYDPSSDLSNGDGFLMRMGPNSGNGATAFALWIENGTLYRATGAGSYKSTSLSSYSLDTVHSLNLVFNNSDSDVSYNGDTIASQTMNVYLDGDLVGDNIAGSGGSVGSAIELFNFTSMTSADPALDFAGTIYLDNMSVDNAIPESSSSAFLVGLGAALVALVQRRRKARS